MKDEQNYSYNGGGDAYLLKIWSDSSSIHYYKYVINITPERIFFRNCISTDQILGNKYISYFDQYYFSSKLI